MKMQKLKSSAFVGLTALLLFCPSLKKGELTDIAKPYLGVYTCREAKLGTQDVLTKFSYITIELKDGENCVLRYQEKDDKVHTVHGKYAYDKKGEYLTLSLADASFIKREFPVKDGVLFITVPFLGQTLRMQFEQK